MPCTDHDAGDGCDEDDEESGSLEADLDEREAPDADDADWNLDPDVVPCPHCGEKISEDAQLCPKCGEYISFEDAPPDKKPLWIWIGLVLLLLASLTWILIP